MDKKKLPETMMLYARIAKMQLMFPLELVDKRYDLKLDQTTQLWKFKA